MDLKIPEENLLTLFLIFYQKLNGQFSAYSVWTLLKFIKYFGTDSTALPLPKLAKILGVQVKKLREVLHDLEQQGVLEVSYPETGRRARVRHLLLRLDYIKIDPNQLLVKLINENIRQNKQIPLLQFIKIVFKKSETLSISNLVQKLEMNCSLDYRSYLVLLRLLYGADYFGVVIGCGIGEIERATGLSKQSIYRALHLLKQLGFIRSQANGAIRNSFIQTEAPIYALNLSHAFWDNKAKYGKFIILKYPKPHVFEVQKVASIFTILDQMSDKFQNDGHENSNASAEILNFKNSYLLRDPLCWMKTYIPSSYPIRNSLYFDYFELQKNELLKFFDHYLDLKKLNHDNPCVAEFHLKLHENIFEDDYERDKSESIQQKKLNGMYNRLGLFQSLLEQWCCQIYSQNKRLFRNLREANPVTIDDEHFNRLDCFDCLYSYTLKDSEIKVIKEDMILKNKSARIESMITSRLMAEQSKIHQLLLAIMDKIAYNQIHYFQQCMNIVSNSGNKSVLEQTEFEDMQAKKQQSEMPFRILPRSFTQNSYSCFFVPDQNAKANQYFLSELKFQKPSHDGAQFDYPVQDTIEISPTLDDLKDYGIIHHTCLSLSK